ncbi:hypothetical protein [Moorella sp. E308F]|uniref:hypothetical protein n=1 Tax=Moorella sp. E308F TaxID=2572682 RepID=UPI001C0EA166|nr:hypothetical protein [Moorella sp. E308F]
MVKYEPVTFTDWYGETFLRGIIMKININYDTNDLKRLVLNDLKLKLPGVNFKETDIEILVKTKQNYRAEWENGDFKAFVNFDSFRGDLNGFSA